MRHFISYKVSQHDRNALKQRILFGLEGYDRFCYLDSNFPEGDCEFPSREDKPHHCIAAAGKIDEVISEPGNAFNALKEFYKRKKDWLFGFFSYDLKNEVEALASGHSDGICMPALHFFQPEYVFIVRGNELLVGVLEGHFQRTEIERIIYGPLFNAPRKQGQSIHIEPQSPVGRGQYLEAVKKIKEHIRRGDIYEVNFCREFFARADEFAPLEVFDRLNRISGAPFSCCYRLDDKYLICASPERFMKKTGSRIISQPVKGTARRGSTAREDLRLRQELFSDPKERSENVMIVDIVRNDLSRTAVRGSVRVDELFGLFTYKQVHQLVSTVSSVLRDDVHFVDAIRNAFPMGSMTGAPKVRAMELIERYESAKRGLFSGAAGYITPDGDFDLNVVIRSILYNRKRKSLSFMAGSAITDKSIPEREYAECMWKAKAMFEVLGQTQKNSAELYSSETGFGKK